MLITMMKGKIHKATVTEANLNYIGSITIDKNLLDASGIREGEKVQIVNNNNGARLETYTIMGEAGSGIVCLNGAAARLVQKGDEIIIIAYAIIDEVEVEYFKPNVIFVDKNNSIVSSIIKELPLTSA